jgi:xanthine dehydrogenase accessory factor
MEEVIPAIRRWQGEGAAVALATVVQTWGSSPRKVGAKMAITADGKLSGSVSGGCVEGAVAEEAFAALASGRPKLLSFGVADETAWEVGLACGGSIQVFVEALDRDLFGAIQRLVEVERAGAVATVIAGPETLLGRKLLVDGQGVRTGCIDPALDDSIAAMLATAITRGVCQRVALTDPTVELFMDVLLPPPALVMVGGVHIAVALASIAKTLGYRTIVIDPRAAFGSAERFPHADRLLAMWPQDAFPHIALNENTAVALLTHDPKIDDPALESVLDSPVFYIGALGSRKTHASRLARLHAAGLNEEKLAKIRGPIGLEIQAQTPEEIALAIMAEIVKVRRE